MQRSHTVTVWLIRQRLRYTGRRCFSYAGLRNTYNYFRRKGSVDVDWHSVEREVRRLAEAGVLQRIVIRVDGRRKAIFCANGL